MSLPPEQIRIKRRREEEPVETLCPNPTLGDPSSYIQSQTREPKRRFTDFVFKRVTPIQDEALVSGMSSPGGAKGITKTTPRPDSMSAAIQGPSVPIVRATEPGAEVEELRHLLELAKKRSRASLAKPHTRSVSAKFPSQSSSQAMSTVSIQSALRKFYITTPEPDDLVLHKVGGGVLKRKLPKHAVVVEQKGDGIKSVSTLGELANDVGGPSNIRAEDVKREVEAADGKSSITTSRRRRVVNEAERRWKEQTGAYRYLDRQDHKEKEKTGKSIRDDPATWDYDSIQLVNELEQASWEAIAADPTNPVYPPRPRRRRYLPIVKPPLKFQPRLPKHQRDRDKGRGGVFGQLDESGGSSKESAACHEISTVGKGLEDVSSMRNALEEHVVCAKVENDDDTDYVYDIFIRRPLQEVAGDPKFVPFHDGHWYAEHENVPKDIGVVVISEQDVHYWDALAEDDDEEKGWNTDDEDSNGEPFYFLGLHFVDSR
ncbi:predicted protein [Uncinocarpus reesii 1704]|uniref:Transcription factor Iwr1 domain-containing protein n=1 Tax=Uncinocarpus reesii (strain UAMH 1704) TaxID=336963 RepID=C4JEB0_UNCRE|nr:uncharacterized protein UREG_00744 [Uncinocarpus reesii 1704]EEP75897.1 predicted protein [Uncinocarpus reesii 1704]